MSYVSDYEAVKSGEVCIDNFSYYNTDEPEG